MWSRSLAAALLGLPLTVGLVGLATRLLPRALGDHTLLLLVCAFVVWVALLALPFALRSGRSAWLVMGDGTLLCFGVLQVLKALGWPGVAA
ncbi:hypothetical protein [Pelomonas cellulosilytica]|uniref:Uncharacterized protein n=1 Tax=Pelomonas cellulosilytica TaxID=2906762 RepID=A0ABS8XRQ9_9BURK|nr:hypothetical protein [Pelomonas sp. P8]MCE4553531.1 hypothetical protein [Pelomonas sp. P8]